MRDKHILWGSKVLALILMAIVSSCIDDVDDINLPKTEPKLVVESYIGPNDSLIVSVRASRPINYNIPAVDEWSENNYVTVSDAIVVIKNNGSNAEITLPFLQDIGKYALPAEAFSIEPGAEYSLSVSASGYKDVNGSTKVPSNIPAVSSITIDTLGQDEWGDRTILISGSISDTPNQSNFYVVTVYSHFSYSWDETAEQYIELAGRELFTDSEKDGQEIGYKLEVWDYSGSDGENSLLIYIYSVDQHYYNFHKSIENVTDYEDNPFAESSHLYSNIEGGLGIFASYVTAYAVSTK
jgi:hypothetical protein